MQLWLLFLNFGAILEPTKLFGILNCNWEMLSGFVLSVSDDLLYFSAKLI